MIVGHFKIYQTITAKATSYAVDFALQFAGLCGLACRVAPMVA